MKVGGRRTVRRVAIAVSLAVATLVWPGCAESDERTLPGRTSPSAEERPVAPEDGASTDAFADAANEVCERADERVSEIDAPRSDDEWLGFGRRVEDRFVRMTDDLAALDPPRTLDAEVRKWLRKLEASRRAFRSLYTTAPRHSWTAVGAEGEVVKRVMDRAFSTDVDAREWAQLHLTDLYSCYNVTPWYYARRAGA